MELIDWITLGLFFLTVTSVGLYFSRRSSKSTEDFILAGRQLPWWLAGSSMTAGSFNADSPLHQTRKIRETGLAGNWFYWSEIPGLILGALIFGPLWRRTGIQTVVEFYELRYSGIGARILRIYSALHVAFFEGCIFAAIGLLGLRKISGVLFDLPESIAFLGLSVPTDLIFVIGAVLIALVYSAAAGLWGVVWTDFIELLVALGCSWLLAWVVMRAVGYGDGLQEALAVSPDRDFNFLSWLPEWGPVIFVYFIVRPILSAPGINHTNQRFLSVKDEREAVMSALWRIISHFVIRGWPWYLCGLASLILLPEARLIDLGITTATGAADHEKVYPLLIREFLPVGLTGLMLAGFLSAFMSSIDTTIHTSASIFLNDLYRPFINKDGSDKHYLMVTRIVMVAVTAIAIYIALSVGSILNLLIFVVKVIQGMGLVMILRWFWWRVTAWTELGAYLGAMSSTLFIDFSPWGKTLVHTLQSRMEWYGWDSTFSITYCFVALVTTSVALVITWITPANNPAHLKIFHGRVKPPGWWGPFRENEADTWNYRKVVFQWLLGTVFSLSCVFMVGMLGLGFTLPGLVAMMVFLGSGVGLVRSLKA